MSEADYAAGIARVCSDIEAAAARGEELHFETDIRLFANAALRA
jgi:hypothetical protein